MLKGIVRFFKEFFIGSKEEEEVVVETPQRLSREEVREKTIQNVKSYSGPIYWAHKAVEIKKELGNSVPQPSYAEQRRIMRAQLEAQSKTLEDYYRLRELFVPSN